MNSGNQTRKKRAYLIRYGAYGDHLHMSPVLRALKEEGYEVTFEYNTKGAQIHSFNPHIDKHVVHEPEKGLYTKEEKACYRHYKRIQEIRRQYDKFVDFGGSLEQALIADEMSVDYFRSKAERDRKFGQISFEDQTMKWAGLPKKYWGRKPEVYFRKREHDRIREHLQELHDSGKYIILWSIAGSMWQKAIYPWSKKVCDEFQKRHPETHIFITAGPEYKDFVWEGPNVTSVVGKWPFRQALLACRYLNLVVTPETGIGIGAGAYDTPKIMLMTAASVKNIVGNHKNDFSIQSEAWCSPCHRAIYHMDHCDTQPIEGEYKVYHDPQGSKEPKTANKLPICVFFDENRVLAQMEKAYASGHQPDWSSSEESVYI